MYFKAFHIKKGMKSSTSIWSKVVMVMCVVSINVANVNAQSVFARDFSPNAGLVTPQEQPYREEICLNGLWEVQCIPLPDFWKAGTGIAPKLVPPLPNGWEKTCIKIPSPINVNNWGQGYSTGEGTEHPYTSSSVYFPSYPEHWNHVRMAWLRRNFLVPASWNGKKERLILHFEAVAGECTVFLNGKEVGHNFDSHLPFEVDVTDAVRLGAGNELLVGVRHRRLFDKYHPLYKKMEATYPTGSNTDDLLGIWQDVYLLKVPQICVTDVFVQPWVDCGKLQLEVAVTNHSADEQSVTVSGQIKPWLNHAGTDVLSAPEIAWSLGETLLSVPESLQKLPAGSSKTLTLSISVTDELELWTPNAPNLYTAILHIDNGSGTWDCKAVRFGWRQFTIAGDEFLLNGKPVQCFGDIQHPFSAYICSRCFAYAWYRMIKDFGGNAMRPHAQPWPRLYYDLADEMGLLVLDETALFGSFTRLNFEEDDTWNRSREHLKRLILRDRNHPSVVEWSVGNETFAIALLNKASEEAAAIWNNKLVDLAGSTRALDPTREFITLDGDRDMQGRLPVWSKHFAHGLKLDDLPIGLDKPLVVGESGATYYGRPSQLYPFVGEDAYRDYRGRNDALTIDVYQNVRQMALPKLAYYSSSELCWFGLEHLNLGYHDFTRLPRLSDGIFPGKPYEEGKPGYQYERIPPYVTTFNPGLDDSLPLYKPLPMFQALKEALSDGGQWRHYCEKKHPQRPGFPQPRYAAVWLAGTPQSDLLRFVEVVGLSIKKRPQEADLREVTAFLQKKHGRVLALGKGRNFTDAFLGWLPADVQLTERRATALENNRQTDWGRYFELPDLYFSEMSGDRCILKRGLSGELVDKGTMVLKVSRTDWTLFNDVPEHWKCAQVVLYEALQKPDGAALVHYDSDDMDLLLSVIDYSLRTKETQAFWRTLLRAMGVDLKEPDIVEKEKQASDHDLLLDGPVD